MEYDNHLPVSKKTIKKIDKIIKEKNKDNTIKLIDIGDIFKENIPLANLNTRFTPYCMLRLFADLVDLPDMVLYLDNDVVCHKNCEELMNIDMSKWEIAGALDRYGKWIYRGKVLTLDYINSGVLLMNLKLLRENGTLKKCRLYCSDEKKLLPDQAALNKFCRKQILKRKYNEQLRTKRKTVFRHFTTKFPFVIKSISTIKPWQIDKVHKVLREFDYDDILDEYLKIKAEIKNEK